MANHRIVILAQPGELVDVTYNMINEVYPVDKVIFEAPEPRGKFLRRRISRMGYRRVFGQIMFQLGVVPFLRREASARIAEIKGQFALDDTPIPQDKIIHVGSVNSKKTRLMLSDMDPDVLLVVGTRIISKRVLNSVPGKFINIHCGITPLYRGSHGGYWALVQQQKDACGVTVHYVDPGIDTGEILYQGLIEPNETDNYYTYPYLQFGVGVPLMKQAVESALNDRLETRPGPTGDSRLWSHPTIFEYLRNRRRLGVR